MNPEPIVVMVAAGDPDEAHLLARLVVGERLAACAQILPITSCYWWEGEVTASTESLILFKSTMAHYVDLERAILSAHSYEIPEIIALPVSAGLPAYLRWLQKETDGAGS